jgi:hypothetical protein
MWRHYLLFVLDFFIAGSSLAQFDPQIPSMSGNVSPSAEASAVARVNQIPVNYYTGIPQIAYPIHNFSQQGLSLALSLSYFAGGNKVEETATNTGLGWTLNSGGFILRSVRGLPDDYPRVGFMYAANIPASPGVDLDSFYRDQKDSEMDVFQFNLNGRSGKFYMGKNNKILVVPDEKLKIERTLGVISDAPASTIVSFTITTEDGIRYVFKERELSKIAAYGETSLYLNKYYVTSWYISDIVAPFKTDSIHFTYDLHNNYYTSRTPELTVTDPMASNKILQNKSKFVDVYTVSPRVRRINFPDNSSVNFVYDTKSRCDFYSEQALRRIEVEIGEQKKGFLLDYEYSTPSGFISYRKPCSGDVKSNRLMLRQITEYTKQGQTAPTIYEYEEDVMLPARDSKSIDFWGFYNGKENTTLVPPFNTLTGGDRSPDLHFMRAGSLKRIRHPQGGQTVLEYEANENFTISKQQLSQDIYYDHYNATLLNVNKLFDKEVGLTLKFAGENYRQYFSNLPNTTGTIGCKITADDGVVSVFEATFSIQQLVFGNQFFTIQLPYNGNYLLKMTYNNFTASDKPNLVFNIGWSNDRVLEDKKQVGGLRIKRQTLFDGLSHDNDIVTEYRYISADGTGSGYDLEAPVYYYRTGVTANNTYYPADVRMSEPFNGLTYIQGSPSGYARVEVINGRPERNNGKVVYEFTSFKDLMEGDTPPWFYQNYTDTDQFPYIPKDKADWMLGLPVVTSSYGPDGRLLQKRNNYYSFTKFNNTSSDFKSLKVGVDREILQGTTRTNNYVLKDYYPLQGTARTASATETNYFEDGSSSTNQINYEYDDANLTLRKVVSDYNRSKNLRLEKRFYYPYDYTVTGGIAELKKAGIVTTIATETWLTGPSTNQLFDMSVTDYKVLGSGIVRPASMYKLYLKTPLEDSQVPVFNPAVLNRVPGQLKENYVYDAYSAKGNLIQGRDVLTGEVSAIILDDVMQVPLAKVSDATISEIAYTSFESSTKGQWNYTGAPQPDSKAATGKMDYLLTKGAISKTAMPTGKDYVLSFWAKDGTASVNGGTLTGSYTNTVSGWTCYRYRVGGGSAVSIAGTATIDEIRIYPRNALMQTICYEPGVGELSSCDPYDKIAYTEYDRANRLKALKDQDGNVVKWYEYNDLAPAYSNAIVSKSFVRSCPGGQGSTVVYEVPAGKYKSYISAEDANDMAQEDMNLNGQNNANSKGICTFYNTDRSQDFTKDCPSGFTGSIVKYTVPAGKYSSNISVDDANVKAQQEIDLYGQGNANSKGQCDPNILYLKFSVEDRRSSTVTNRDFETKTTTVDLVVRFYTDAACTIPYVVSGFNVNVNIRSAFESYIEEEFYSNESTSGTTYLCNGNTMIMANDIPEEVYVRYRKYVGSAEVISTDYDKTTYTYTVAPSSRYIVK